MRNTGNQVSRLYGNNISNPFMTFESDERWNPTSGVGSGTHSSLNRYAEKQSLRIDNEDPTQQLTISYVNSDISTVVEIDGNYIISFFVKNATDEDLTGRLRLYKNAVLDRTVEIDVVSTDEGVWVQYFNQVPFAKGDIITYDFQLDANPTSLLLTNTIYVDGFGIYLNDRNLVYPPYYTKPLTNASELGINVEIKTANYPLQNNDFILADATLGNLTMTLPSPIKDYSIDIKKIDSSTNTITVDGDGVNIDGLATQIIDTQFTTMSVVCDGINWYIR